MFSHKGSLPIHLDTTVTLGRHSTCDLSLDGDAVSNYHCRLVTTKEGVVFCEQDLSTNGTYWNGHLVGKSESVVLSHGDSIRFRTSYSFIYQDFTTIKFTQNDPDIASVFGKYESLSSVPQALLASDRGTFAKVQVGIHRRTKVQLAVKIMDHIRFGSPEHSGGTDIEKEVAILRSVNHPNIVPIVDVIKTRKFVYIFLQMLAGGDLFDYVVKAGPLPDMEAKFVAYQVLQALKYLHERNISHRDLKPENLLLTSSGKFPRIMLADFGMAREQMRNRLMSTMCGTFAYMAPEVFAIKYAKRPGYGHTADCWSLGVSLYVILSGAHPFTDEYATADEKTMRDKMCSSADARSLVRGLLATDPEERFTVDDALASDWISQDLHWLEQKYAEVVTQQWNKHSRLMDEIRRTLQLKRDCDAHSSDEDRPSKRAILESQSDSWSTSASRVPSVSDYETL
ncbi:Meiosis-specific serine/threonine-protein kinase mek1 [Podila horticola]|nr:Meiosis-specific serine/threonine-protein kinase mek1 [Podila horticola]